VSSDVRFWGHFGRQCEPSIEFQLWPSKNTFLAPEKLKLSLISFTNPRASHVRNKGSNPLRGANEFRD
jgi:hypothetical protein